MRIFGNSQERNTNESPIYETRATFSKKLRCHFGGGKGKIMKTLDLL